MQKKSRLGQFWDIFGPLIIQSLIGVGVSMAASMLMLVKNFQEYMKVVMSGNAQAIMDFVNEQTNEVLAYTAHISIATAVCAIPVMLFLFLRDEKRRKTEGVKATACRGMGRYLLIIPFAAAAGLVLNNIMLLADMAVVSEVYNEMAVKQYAIPLAAQFAAYGFITPICEELIFRGLIFKRMREHFPFYTAMFGSAMMFGIFHGNIIQSMYAFVMGVLFAYLYEMYGSLKAPVIAHMVVNLVAVTLTELGVFTWLFADLLRVGTVTVVCAAAASSLFVFFFQRSHFPNLKENETEAGENQQ